MQVMNRFVCVPRWTGSTSMMCMFYIYRILKESSAGKHYVFIIRTDTIFYIKKRQQKITYLFIYIYPFCFISLIYIFSSSLLSYFIHFVHIKQELVVLLDCVNVDKCFVVVFFLVIGNMVFGYFSQHGGQLQSSIFIFL